MVAFIATRLAGSGRALQALVDLLADCGAALRRSLRPAEELSDEALRDLGLHRSELPSYYAEAAGSVAMTRRRVACH